MRRLSTIPMRSRPTSTFLWRVGFHGSTRQTTCRAIEAMADPAKPSLMISVIRLANYLMPVGSDGNVPWVSAQTTAWLPPGAIGSMGSYSILCRQKGRHIQEGCACSPLSPKAWPIA
jgi:hypothetical protein